MRIEFTEITMAFDFVSFGQPFEHQAFLNKQTGKVYWHSEIGDNEEELPDDLDDNKYIEIPHKNDLGLGKSLVLDFINHQLPNETGNIQAIFRKKGAYSKFKRILENYGITDTWYKFESDAHEKALREWCKINEILIHE